MLFYNKELHFLQLEILVLKRKSQNKHSKLNVNGSNKLKVESEWVALSLLNSRTEVLKNVLKMRVLFKCILTIQDVQTQIILETLIMFFSNSFNYAHVTHLFLRRKYVPVSDVPAIFMWIPVGFGGWADGLIPFKHEHGRAFQKSYNFFRIWKLCGYLICPNYPSGLPPSWGAVVPGEGRAQGGPPGACALPRGDGASQDCLVQLFGGVSSQDICHLFT